MRIHFLLKTFAIAGFIVMTACEKTEEPINQSIEGTYIGSLVQENGLKSLGFGREAGDEATAEITHMGEGLIQVHCLGSDLDTTFHLNYYEHDDSVMVCFTGDDFEHFYGHMLGSGHMGGGMMEDVHDGETEWNHHMSDEHDGGDEHFGGFNMHEATFTYSFLMMENSTPYYLRFHGVKD